MSEPIWIHGDPAALSFNACSSCDEPECNCGEEDPDRMYDESMSE